MNIRFLFCLLLLFAFGANAQVQVGVRNERAGAVQNHEDIRIAEEYYKKEEYAKALVYIEKLQKKNIRTKLVYDIGLNSYLGIEDYKSAEKFIEDYIENVRGGNGDYYADLVYVYLEQDKTSKADKTIEELLKNVERNPNLAYGYATAFQQQGFPKIALQIYEKAEEMMPGASYEYQKALLYGEMGDIKKMYAAYVGMVSRTPSYLPTVKQLLGRALSEETNTENSDYLKELLIEKIQKGGSESLNDLLIYVLIQEENFTGAFIQLKALDKRNSSNKGEIYRLGKVALNNQEYDLAQKIFAYVIKAGPTYPFYESALMMDLVAKQEKLELNAMANRDDWKVLQSEYFKVQELLKGKPEVGELAIDLANLSAFQLDETDTAEAILQKVISTGMVSNEIIAEAKIQLADIYLYTGNRWEAILLYGQAEKAFEQSPIGQEAKFKRAKAAYYVGDFMWALGIFDALKTSTSKLIANDAMRYSLLINDNIALDTNMDAMTTYARADLMYYQAKLDSALRLLDIMEIAFPDHVIQGEVLYLKSEILIKQKNFQEAATTLETLLHLYKKNILADNALYDLAQLNEFQLAQPIKAQELYQRLFIEYPDSFFASDSRKRFRALRGDAVVN